MKYNKIKKYLKKAVPFSAYGELYQGVPGISEKATRDLDQRWKIYDIPEQDLKGSIVDLGCNIGGFSVYCEHLCKRYLGIDTDLESIKLARSLFSFSNCDFRTMSFHDLVESFDTVLALAVRRYTELSFEEFAKACVPLVKKKMYFESHGREKWCPKTRKAFEKYFSVLRVVYVPSTSHPDNEHYRFFLELEK